MKRGLFALFVMMLAPALCFAGPHDDCTLCHGVHTGQGPVILTETPNTTSLNPRTGQPFKRIGTLCLACHAEEPDGAGYRPIDLSRTHPVGFKPDPKKVVLPDPSKGWPGEEEDLTCLGCHNQHPSNENYMYLRFTTNGGDDMPMFCGKCHPEKSRRRRK